MHAFAKITLFFAAGAIYLKTGHKYISELKGLAYKMPITFAAIFIASAGVVGLPLTGGFSTKWLLLQASIETDEIILAIVFLLSSFLSSIYLFQIVWQGLKLDSKIDTEISESPIYCLIPLCFTAIMTIVLFFYADLILNFTNLWIK